MTNGQPSRAEEATRRVLDLTAGMFPTPRRGMPDLVRVSVGLLARCVTTAEACLHLAQLGRRSDLMVAVRTLFEHVVTFGWLTGSNDREDRMLLWQRYCDQQALRFDDEIARLGGEPRISPETRAQIAASTKRLGDAKWPGLADRAAQVDREWADRLGFDPEHRDECSLRRTYSVVFRVASSMAHPTLAGVRIVIDHQPAGVTIDLEPSGLAHEALLPVPLLLATGLAMSASVLGKPERLEINAFLDWLVESNPGAWQG
jgi:Family of unknown function (DUF5677)